MSMVSPVNVHALQPPATVGFEHIGRYWDKTNNVHAAKILPGELYVSSHGEMVVTVLGSCVSACIRDKKLGVGGMNHFMLPIQKDGKSDSRSDYMNQAARYGNWAMEFLINEIYKLGGRKENLEVKVFGGGQVLANMTDVGKKNIDFVLHFLQEEGLRIEAQNVGDVYARKLLYFSDTGAVKMKKINKTENNTIQEREEKYFLDLSKESSTGDVELF